MEMPKQDLSKSDFLKSFSAVPAIVDGCGEVFRDRLPVYVAPRNLSRLLRKSPGTF
jgi:hypothetical protein